MWLANKLLYANALTAASSSVANRHLRRRERFRAILTASESTLRSLENSPKQTTEDGAPRVPSSNPLCTRCVRLLSAARTEGWLRALLSEHLSQSLLFLDTSSRAGHLESSSIGRLLSLLVGSTDSNAISSVSLSDSHFTKIKPKSHPTRSDGCAGSVNDGSKGTLAATTGKGQEDIPRPSDSHDAENPALVTPTLLVTKPISNGHFSRNEGRTFNSLEAELSTFIVRLLLVRMHSYTV